MLKTQRTQDGKNNQDQRQHCDKIDILKCDEPLMGFARHRHCCAGHSCIEPIVKIGINAVATRNASPDAQPFST
jgi:hypothetical protein